MRLFFLIFLAMVSCDHQRTTQPHHIKDSLAYDIESIKIIPSNDILELKSYHITSPFSCQNIDGIIAYNYRLHSLDLIDLYNHKEISSIPLQREGPDGIPGRVAGIFPLSKDSIWVYDGIYMYLLNSAGRVNEKITLEDRESLIINTNYAMNTAKFSYNPNIIRKSKFPQNPKRSVRFSGKGTKRSVQKRKARNTQKAETKVL